MEFRHEELTLYQFTLSGAAAWALQSLSAETFAGTIKEISNLPSNHFFTKNGAPATRLQQGKVPGMLYNDRYFHRHESKSIQMVFLLSVWFGSR